MTGPEHYRAAELLLQPTKQRGPWSDGSGDDVAGPTAQAVAKAQVHATLALAAATAMAAAANPGNMPSADREAWSDAAATSTSYGAGSSR